MIWMLTLFVALNFPPVMEMEVDIDDDPIFDKEIYLLDLTPTPRQLLEGVNEAE